MKTALKLISAILIISHLSFSQSVSFTPTGAKITANPANGKVLTSDVHGKGTWQNPSNINSGLQVLTTEQISSIPNPVVGTKLYDSYNKKKVIFDGNEWVGFEAEPLVYPPLVQKKNNDPQPFDAFGNSVAMLGETVVVGAKGSENEKGAVYVFNRINGFWNQTAKLTASDGVANDKFGYLVKIFDDIIAVRAITGSNSNAVYLFKQNNNTWTQFARLSPNVAGPLFDNSGSFGYTMDFLRNGNDYTILISAPFGNDRKGHIFVCNANPITNTASMVSKIVAQDGALDDYFGNSIYISPVNQQLIAGAAGFNNYTGKVYFFNKSALGGWNTSPSDVKLGTAANAYFGLSIVGGNSHLAIIESQGIKFFEWNGSQWLSHPNSTTSPVVGNPMGIAGSYLIYNNGGSFAVAKYSASNWSKFADGINRISVGTSNINDVIAGINSDGRFAVAGYDVVNGMEVNKFVFGFAGY